MNIYAIYVNSCFLMVLSCFFFSNALNIFANWILAKALAFNFIDFFFLFENKKD